MAKRVIKKKSPQQTAQLDLLSEIEKQSYTPEQRRFVEFNGEESVVLSATAGSGKTFSCVQRVRELLRRGVDPGKIIFFSFTKAATEELKSRIGNKDIKITTIHAFCYHILIKTGKYKEIASFYDFIEWFKIKYRPKHYADQEAKDFYYETISTLYEDGDFISSSIASFKLQSAEGIKSKIPPYLYEYNTFIREKKMRDFSDMLVEVRDMFKEEKWLKMFRGKYDYIFIDEYQDTSTIQLQILLALNAKYYYLIGDINQCVIAGTKIHTEQGLKKVEDLTIDDKVLSGKGTDKLIYNKITDIFKNRFSGEVIKITTESGKELTTTKNHTHFAKYVINNKEWFFTYLIYEQVCGFRIGVTRSYHNKNCVKKRGMFSFLNKLNSKNDQKIWLLGAFETERESKVKELEYSLKYGIPTIEFKSRTSSLIPAKEYMNYVFNTIDTEVGADKLLKDFGYEFEIPHHFSKSINNKISDRNMNIYLCQDGNGLKSSHRIEVSGKLDSDKKILESFGLKVKDNKKNNGWRISKQSSDFYDIINVKNKVLSLIDSVENMGVLLKKGSALNMVKATYLLPGMTIYVLDDNGDIQYDIIKSISIEKYTNYVYDINVENTHNFIANGIFTHNSIYGYSGANCKLLENMVKARRKIAELSLSVNFRSDKVIVENSNKFSSLKAVANSKEEGYVDDKVMLKLDELVELLKLPQEVAVLVRTNEVIKKLEKQLLKRKIPMKFFNFITERDIENFDKGVITDGLKNKLKSVRDFFNNSDAEVISFIKTHKNSNKFVTTIHKSKGREFHTCVVVNSVSPELLKQNPNFYKLTKKQIAQISFDPDDEDDVEPRNIHYVAVSRSKHKLYFMIYMTK